MIEQQLRKQSNDFALVRKLSAKFGPMVSDDGHMRRVDGGEIPEEAIEQAKQEVEADRYWYLLKQECARRILIVTKDAITQINIASWLACTKDKSGDVATARKLIAWIAETREAARRMRKSNKNFKDDRLWPKPPSGVDKLVERF